MSDTLWGWLIPVVIGIGGLLGAICDFGADSPGATVSEPVCYYACRNWQDCSKDFPCSVFILKCEHNPDETSTTTKQEQCCEICNTYPYDATSLSNS